MCEIRKERVAVGIGRCDAQCGQTVGDLVHIDRRAVQRLAAADDQAAVFTVLGDVRSHADENVNHSLVTLTVIKVDAGDDQLARRADGSDQREGHARPVGGDTALLREILLAALDTEETVVLADLKLSAVAVHPVNRHLQVRSLQRLFHPDLRLAAGIQHGCGQKDPGDVLAGKSIEVAHAALHRAADHDRRHSLPGRVCRQNAPSSCMALVCAPQGRRQICSSPVMTA